MVRGEIIGTKSSTFEGKTSQAIQVLKRNGKGAAEVMNVKLLDGADLRDFPEGKLVELPVDVSTYEGSIYFKALPASKKAAEPSRSAPAKT